MMSMHCSFSQFLGRPKDSKLFCSFLVVLENILYRLRLHSTMLRNDLGGKVVCVELELGLKLMSNCSGTYHYTGVITEGR
jgi:hypothetical protein